MSEHFLRKKRIKEIFGVYERYVMKVPIGVETDITHDWLLEYSGFDSIDPDINSFLLTFTETFNQMDETSRKLIWLTERERKTDQELIEVFGNNRFWITRQRKKTYKKFVDALL